MISRQLNVTLARNTDLIPDTEFALNHQLVNNCSSIRVVSIKRNQYRFANQTHDVSICDEFHVTLVANNPAMSIEDILEVLKTNLTMYDVLYYKDELTGERKFIQYEHESSSIPGFKLEGNNEVSSKSVSHFSDLKKSSHAFELSAIDSFNAGEYLEALFLFKKFYLLSKKINNDSIHCLDVAKALYNMSSCALKLRNTYTAAQLLTKACLILGMMEQAPDKTRFKYFEKLALILIERGQYQNAINWLEACIRITSILNEDRERIINKKQEVESFVEDKSLSCHPNPFGMFNHKSVVGTTSRFLVGKTATKTDPSGAVVEITRSDEIITPMKPYDPSKWTLLLEAALKAKRNDHHIKFQRILMSVPSL